MNYKTNKDIYESILDENNITSTNIDDVDSIDFLNIILDIEEKFNIAIPNELLYFEVLKENVLFEYINEHTLSKEEKNET